MKILYLGNLSDVFCLRWSSWFQAHGVRVVNFHAYPVNAHSISMLRETIREFKPNILHAHYAGKPGLAAVMTGFHPFVATVHGSEVLLSRGWKRMAVRFILGKADLITTDGYHVLHRLVRGWKIPPAKIKIVNFGIDLSTYYWMPHLLMPNPHVQFRTGPDESIYDPMTAVKAMDIVQKSIPEATWEFIQDIPQEQMPEFLNRAWVYVSTATSDAGIASTTAEAMACEKPVIITSVAENDRWVPEYWRFRAGDYQTLASRIIELLQDSQERQIEGIGNRRLIKKSNNLNIEMSKALKLYESLL